MWAGRLRPLVIEGIKKRNQPSREAEDARRGNEGRLVGSNEAANRPTVFYLGLGRVTTGA